MRFWIFIVSILVFAESYSQERFFSYLEGWTNYGLFELEDGFLSYGIVSDEDFENQLSFQEIDSDGLLLNSIVYSIDTSEYVEIRNVNSVLETLSGTVYSIGSIKGVSSEKSVGLFTRHATELGESELNATYDFAELQTFCYSLTPSHLDNRFILTSGINDSLSAPRTGISEIDSEGNIIWHQEFVSEADPTVDWLLPWHILPTPDGGYLLTVQELYSPGGTGFDDEHHVNLIKLDSVGNEEWRIYPGDPAYWSEPGWPVLLDDGTAYFCWNDPYVIGPAVDQRNYNNTINYAFVDILTGALSGYGDYTEFLPPYIVDVEAHVYNPTQTQLLSDGNILISGDDLSRAFLMKVSPEGDHIWHRLLYNPEQNGEPLPIGQSSRFMVKGVRETSDGGFICGGEFTATPGNEIWPNGIQSAFAMKLDSYGCLEEGCQLVGLEDLEIGAFEVYPNPSSDYFDILMPEGVFNAELEVLDIQGKLLESSSIIGPVHRSDLSALAKGVYLLRLVTADRVYATKVQKE